jgi:hypothetical protein
MCIDNILKFYEDLLVALLDGHLPSRFKLILDTIPEGVRDPQCPMRYRLGPAIVPDEEGDDDQG